MRSRPFWIFGQSAGFVFSRSSTYYTPTLVVTYTGPSAYGVKGQKRALAKLPELLAPLPVEEHGPGAGRALVQGETELRHTKPGEGGQR